MIMSNPKTRQRVTAIVTAVVGLFVAAAVIRHFNFDAVLVAISPIGFRGFLAVIAAQVALYLPLGLAWWLVAPGEPPGRVGVFIWGSLMAEAASNVLPFSQLGGVVIATRAVVLGGVSPATAFGSNVVDISMEVAAQVIYTFVGLALLDHRLHFTTWDKPLLHSLLVGLAITACLVGGFIATQRWGSRIIEAMVHRVVPAAGDEAIAVSRFTKAVYGKPLRLWACFGVHVGAWFTTAAGTWLILVFMGRPLPMLSVVAIESLQFAFRNAAFMVPVGLGVQEGAYALLGPLFGLPAEAALALSLIKRTRDISIGVPMLLSWQFVEIRLRLREK
ncbi:MAG: lysylphosphatidylglycerol synthase domain-containing protein [Steroidobacteraceae bacterium]|jgi:putative membrane protein